MIVPSKKLSQLIDAYSNRADLCQLLELDDSLLSLLVNRKRGASSRTIERVCTVLHLPLSDAWEVVEDGDE